MTPARPTQTTKGQHLMQITHHGGRRRIAIVAIACLPLLATGCGGSDDNASTSTQQAATGGSVEDQLGFTRRGVAAASAKVENSIAACMKAEGFEYVPSDPVAAQAALTGKPNMSDEEFERTFGSRTRSPPA